MRKEVFEEYLKALNAKVNDEYYEFNKALLDTTPTNNVTITCKYYDKIDGMSKKLFQNGFSEPWEIKGPIGKGCFLKRSGTHLAITAGSGIMGFIDLIAWIARWRLGLLTPEEEEQFEPDFRFVLYMNFRKEEDTVGVDFFTNLANLCKK